MPFTLAAEVLLRLLLGRAARAAAEVLEVDPARLVVSDDLPRALGIEPAEDEPVRERDEVRREAMAADVRRLPAPLAQLAVEGASDVRADATAAEVAPAVRADEVEGLRQPLAARGAAPARGGGGGGGGGHPRRGGERSAGAPPPEDAPGPPPPGGAGGASPRGLERPRPRQTGGSAPANSGVCPRRLARA